MSTYNPNSILVIDDDKSIRDLVSESLRDKGYNVLVAKNANSALEIMETSMPSLVLLDIWLEGSEMDGLGLLKLIKQKSPSTAVIMISGHGNIRTAVEAIKVGAYDFLEKPFKIERLFITVSHALETQSLYLENNDLRRTDIGPLVNIGDSRATTNMRKECEKLGPTSSRVLIVGGPGSGKEAVARSIHDLSPRSNKPFIVVSCVGMEDHRKFCKELFGEEDEGGMLKKIGALEKVGSGTVFIDEIGLMPAEVQDKLLAALQSNAFKRVNGDKTIELNARIISATSANLEEEVEKGNFSKSLFYRLNIALLKVPALKERKEDIETLSNIFIKQLARDMEVTEVKLSRDAISVMQSYAWPGNIRQLRNVIEWMLIVYGDASSVEITPDMLPDYILSSIGRQYFGFGFDTRNLEIFNKPLREARGLFEREYIIAQLERFGRNVSRTADWIGMDRTALHRKIKFLNISMSDRRGDNGNFDRKRPINSNILSGDSQSPANEAKEAI